MARFNQTFDQPRTVAQTITTNPLSLAAGKGLKYSGIISLGGNFTLVGLAIAALEWVGGAAVQARSVQGYEKTTYTQRFLNNLKP